MNRFLLSDGYSISSVIKGGWQLSTGHTPGAHATREQMLQDMDAFVNAGITTFDFGDIYVGVEELIGDYIRQQHACFGIQARERIQLHTKYVPDITKLQTHSPMDVRTIIKRSLDRLGVKQLDLVQFHWWDYEQGSPVEAMLALQELQREQLIRLIGVTNFDVPHMQQFVDAGVIPSTIQLQYSVLDHRPENGMAEFCARHDIKMLCYGTVAGGFLSERYLRNPEPTDMLENRSLTKYKLIIDDFGGWELFQQLLSTLKAVADKHGTSISTIASAYVLQKPQVAAVIVGARNSAHLGDNTDIASIVLDDQDRRSIEAMTAQSRGPIGDTYSLERYDKRHSGIMHKNNNQK
jgi:aryl-alcohol dehydrogenase-like predicted oxidoreductase